MDKPLNKVLCYFCSKTCFKGDRNLWCNKNDISKVAHGRCLKKGHGVWKYIKVTREL